MKPFSSDLSFLSHTKHLLFFLFVSSWCRLHDQRDEETIRWTLGVDCVVKGMEGYHLDSEGGRTIAWREFDLLGL